MVFQEMYVEKDLEKEISKYFKSKEIIAVVGARQCEKITVVGFLSFHDSHNIFFL